MIETDEILNNIDDEFDDIASAVDPDFADEPDYYEQTEDQVEKVVDNLNWYAKLQVQILSEG